VIDKKFMKRQQAAERLLKKVSDKWIPMTGSHIVSDYDGSEYQCFSNGYIGFMLKEPLPDLRLAEPFNMMKTIEDCERNRVTRETSYHTIVPKDLKDAIKKQKDKNKEKGTDDAAYFDIGNHTYNAQYLLDAYEILGGDITLYQDESNVVSPGIMESENGKAMVMPVRQRR